MYVYCIICGMRKLLSIVLLAIATGHAWAAGACFREAADRYHQDERLLRAIGATENAQGNPQLVISGPGGREYIGLMMISSIWLPELGKFGITRQDLLDPCINVNVGAWVLAEDELKYGRTWKAVGAYNTGVYSADDAAQRRYVSKVARNYSRE